MLGVLGILIIVHECGHFLTARLFGFQTPVFGVGLPFGPYLSLGRRWNTEFRLYAAFLGGFVAIPELGDESNATASSEAFGCTLNPFKKFPIWQRALVAVAGVTFNVIFAYLLMIVMFVSVGRPMNATFCKDYDVSNPIAKNAGIMPGDKIVSIDGHPIQTSEEVIAYLGSRKSTPVLFHLEREAKPIDLTVTTNARGRVGMMLESKATGYFPVEGGPVAVVTTAAAELTDKSRLMVMGLAQMVQGLMPDFGPKQANAAPKAKVTDLHGVLAVISIGSQMLQDDWRSIFMFTIMISMDLAFINLLPWPALDGGHLMFMLIEALRGGKPIEERAHGEMVRWGFLSLIALMVLVMANDVTALMSGQLNMKAMKKQQEEQSKKDTKPKTGADGAAGTDTTPASETKVEPEPAPSAEPAPEVKPEPAK